MQDIDDPKPEEEMTCGWRSFKPKILQKLNTPKWFLFFLTIYSFMQGMVTNGFTAAGLTSLEKRFKLTSQQTGMIIAASDLSTLLLIIFISYYAGHRHKARWLGLGALVTSLGCLLFALPHILVGKYVPTIFETTDKTADRCLILNSNSTSSRPDEICQDTQTKDWKYMFVFIGAKLLLGAGTTPLFTLGPAYIDENVDPKSAPMYLGVWFVAVFFGPGIGYVAGGSLLNVWVDLIQPPGVDLTPDDPRWIGAWWVGYFFGGLVLLLTALSLLAYPKEMPGARERRTRAIKEGILPPRDDQIKGRWKDIIPATKALLTNATFVCNTLALSCTTLIALGLGPFISKFIQSQFGEPSSTAGILSGVVIIPGTAGGIFLGSYFMKRVDLRKSCRTAARYCFIFQFIGTFGMLTFLIPGCRTNHIAGINTPYFNSGDGNLTTACNVLCHCVTGAYTPVCGADGVTYYSPCHAGCTKRINQKEYDLCRCIPPLVNSTKFGYAKAGSCDRDCKNLIPFLIGMLVLLVFNFMSATPNKTVVLRCVPDNQRTYALGLQWMTLSVFGSLPGPIMFGTFIDKTCNLWEDNCGKKGSCLEYDNELLSYILVAIGLFFQVLTTFFYFGSWYFCKKNEQAAREQPGGVIEMSVPGASGQVAGASGLGTSSNQELGHCSAALITSDSDLDVDVRTFGDRSLPLTQHESAI